MRILYIHQLFKTPKEGGGIRSYYLAKALVDAGHEVDVITTSNSTSGTEKVDGINVHHLHIPYDNSFGFVKRIKAYGRFVLRARKKAKKLPRPDLAYVMTTPLTTGWIATWIKRKRKVPYFFEVGDLWPEVPIEMGVIKNRLLISWLLKKEKKFYDEAECVIAMSPPQVENIRSKTQTPVELIPNMADTVFFQANFRKEKITHEKPLKVLYCGAHGRANHLEFLILCAQNSADLPIRFTLMGDGSEKARLQLLAMGLNNVIFLPHGDKEEVKNELEHSDAVYLSFQNLPVLHTGCPNKFFDALAAGKMVFSNLSGWTAELIKDKEIGFSYNPERPSEFVEQVMNFLDERNVRNAQTRSLELSNEYARSKLSAQFLACVENR